MCVSVCGGMCVWGGVYLWGVCGHFCVWDVGVSVCRECVWEGCVGGMCVDVCV